MNTLKKRFKYFVGLGFAGLLVVSGLFAVVAPAQSVQAASPSSGTWQSATMIQYNNQSFSGPAATGSVWRYTSSTSVRCTDPSTGVMSAKYDFIEFSENPTAAGAGATTGFYDNWEKHDPTGSLAGADNCEEVERDKRITLAAPERAKLTAASAACATRPIAEQGQCLQEQANEICKNRAYNEQAACIQAQTSPIPPGGLTGATAGAGAPPPDSTSAVPDPELECGVSWNPLTWLLCPFIHMINGALLGLDTAISNLLSVEQNKIFSLTNADGTDNPTGQGYYLAWKSFRSIALGLLIIGALVMIVGQALGFEVLDPYTVKKILPRLIVAIIGIALSWDIMKFFVGFTNDLGEGIRSMIYFPFKGMGNAEVLNGGGSTILTLLLSGGLLAFGVAGLLSFGLTALLGIIVAFLVLVLRQLVIIVLILFAPIAIAAYILPNTQSVWKLWYESFTKALMMFPIIMAFLAVGRVMAVTSTGPDATAIGKVVGLVAYVLPYFLIPLTFRFAGGALRTLGGFVNDQGRGSFDRLKKYRANTVARRGHEWKGGSLYQDRGLGKVVNNLGRRAAVGTQGRFGVGRTGRAAMGTAQQARIQETLKNNTALAELQNNDDANAVLALSGGSTGGARQAVNELKTSWLEGDTEKYLTARNAYQNGTLSSTDFAAAQTEYDKAEAKAEVRAQDAFAGAQGVGFSRENAAAALQTVARNKSRAIGAGRHDLVQNGINRLSGGNKAEADSAAFSYQYFSRDSGRADLGGNWMLSKENTVKAAALAARTGTSQQRAVADMVALDGMGRTEVPAMVRGHTGQLRQNAETLQRMFVAGDDEQKRLAAVRMLEMQKNMSYGSGDNQKIINDLMKQVGVDYSKDPSVEDQLAAQLTRTTGGRVTAGGVELTREARTYDREKYQQDVNNP